MNANRGSVSALVLLLTWSTAYSDGTISIADCEIAGIPFAAHRELVNQRLGEPKPQPDFCADGCFDVIDYPYEYDGIEIIMHQDEAWSFTVTSPDFRLKSGVGVGTSVQEVLDTYGRPETISEGTTSVLTYGVLWTNGKRSRVFLDFSVADGNVGKYVLAIR